ncbi:DUF6268 family outer membrane beta-barrel protein [Shewanella psychrotolerans]|uniref:DUF6268 family outer membrane beta-barrel protein n=1 Tax=Shewanella psychrotolerans TaxID=2864206 RepID=UPI001C65578B|nr:DUF6268 family outer membrane beta-barrel protein [Shewanella psychrotolerans]QYK00371.1 autotransporter outer membrane beta-barrel domain-containing protein [Shewanella psychrotolerans]
MNALLKPNFITLSLMLGWCAYIPVSQAASKPYSPLSISVSRISSANADVGDGNLQLQRDTWLFGAKTAIPLNRQWSMSFSVNYDQLDYDWGSRAGTILGNNIQTWPSVDRYSASIGLSYRPDKHWMFIFAPKIQYAYADGTSFSDAQSYGVVASGMYRFENGNMLGLGVAYLNDISEVRTVPYLAVNWQITDNLKLGNPFSAGFSGPAGLELSYRLNDSVDFGFGTSKRTQRFLVKNDDTTMEVDEWVSFVRAGWAATSSLLVNGYLGYYFNSELELSEPSITEEMDNQLAFAIAAQYKF